MCSQTPIRSCSGADGVPVLELCHFTRDESGEYLVMPREAVDMTLLNSVGAEIQAAITNPFFGKL